VSQSKTLANFSEIRSAFTFGNGFSLRDESFSEAFLHPQTFLRITEQFDML
jgi:hypothetical protein